MAKLHVDVFGNPIQYLKTEEQESQYPNAPSGTAETLEFDLGTNAALGAQLDTDWIGCRVAAGQFFYHDVLQTINAPSGRFSDRAAVKAIWVKLRADQAVTAAEVRLLLRYILRKIASLD